MPGNFPAGFYAFGCLSASLVFAAIIAFVAAHRHRKAQYNKRNADQDENESRKSTSGLGVAEKDNAKTQKNATNTYALERDGFDYITIAIAAVGLIALVYYTTTNYWLYETTARQLNDQEAAQAARLTIEDFKITVLQPFPDLKFRIKSCTIKNIGNTVADGLTFSGGGGGGNLPSPTVPDPRMSVPKQEPVPNGPSLASGRQRDCPNVGETGEEDRRGQDKFPQFHTEWLAVSYFDIFGRTHITSDCLTARSDGMSLFEPCRGGYQHE